MVVKNQTYGNADLWIRKEGNACRVGVSHEILEMLRDSAFVDLPSLGEIEVGDPLLYVETSKVAHELCSPLSGKIREVNESLFENEKANWIALIEKVE